MPKDSSPHPSPTGLSPEEAVDRLEALHKAATDALREALERFFATGAPPTAEERALFRYPELRVSYHPTGPQPVTKRAYAKFQGPGDYATTVTQPAREMGQAAARMLFAGLARPAPVHATARAPVELFDVELQLRESVGPAASD